MVSASRAAVESGRTRSARTLVKRGTDSELASAFGDGASMSRSRQSSARLNIWFSRSGRSTSYSCICSSSASLKSHVSGATASSSPPAPPGGADAAEGAPAAFAGCVRARGGGASSSLLSSILSHLL